MNGGAGKGRPKGSRNAALCTDCGDEFMPGQKRHRVWRGGSSSGHGVLPGVVLCGSCKRMRMTPESEGGWKPTRAVAR